MLDAEIEQIADRDRRQSRFMAEERTPRYESFELILLRVAQPGKNLYQNRATADCADIRLNIGAEAIEFIGIEVEMIVLDPNRISVSDQALCRFRHGFGPYIHVGKIPMQNGAAPRGVDSI